MVTVVLYQVVLQDATLAFMESLLVPSPGWERVRVRGVE
jgi:hypothetical protein